MLLNPYSLTVISVVICGKLQYYLWGTVECLISRFLISLLWKLHGKDDAEVEIFIRRGKRCKYI